MCRRDCFTILIGRAGAHTLGVRNFCQVLKFVDSDVDMSITNQVFMIVAYVRCLESASLFFCLPLWVFPLLIRPQNFEKICWRTTTLVLSDARFVRSETSSFPSITEASILSLNTHTSRCTSIQNLRSIRCLWWVSEELKNDQLSSSGDIYGQT